MAGHDPDPGGTRDDAVPPDPLGGFAAHAKEAVAAGRARLSVLADQAGGSLYRLAVRALLLVVGLCLAAAFAGFGIHHLIGGSIGGLEGPLGSRWAARLVVGGACAAASAALIICPLWRARRNRMTRLREKYGPPTQERP